GPGCESGTCGQVLSRIQEPATSTRLPGKETVEFAPPPRTSPTPCCKSFVAIAAAILVCCLALRARSLKKQRYVSCGPVDVLPGLQQDRQSGGNHVSSQFRCSQQSQSVNPIERFANRGWLSHSQVTDSSREPGYLRSKLRLERRRMNCDDLGLLIWRGII